MVQDCFHLRNSRLWSESPPSAYTFWRDGAVIQKGAASSYNTTHVTYRDNIVWMLTSQIKKPKKIPFLRLIRNHSTGCWEIADVSQYLIWVITWILLSRLWRNSSMHVFIYSMNFFQHALHPTRWSLKITEEEVVVSHWLLIITS